MIIIIIIILFTSGPRAIPGPRDAEDRLANQQHSKSGELLYCMNWFKYGDCSEFRVQCDRTAKADRPPLTISQCRRCLHPAPLARLNDVPKYKYRDDVTFFFPNEYIM